MVCRDFHQAGDDLIDVRAIGNADRDAQAVLDVRAARFVDDLGASHDAVGNADLLVIAGQKARAAQTDVRYAPTFPGVQHDVVVDPVGLVDEDGDAGEKVAERVLGSEGEREADDTG